MKTEQLNYDLPAELIAQHPADIRGDSRLLIVDRFAEKLFDSQFNAIGDFLVPGDCLVLNDTRVLCARFFGQRASGAKLEGLFLRENEGRTWQVMLKGARKVKIGETIYLKDKENNDKYQAVLKEKLPDGKCLLKIGTDIGVESILEDIGFPPLPPYIKRGRDAGQAEIDKLRYQTVYAQKSGAVAAPTAGMHFTNELIEQLKGKGVTFAYVTLHVGAGTFKPVTAENLGDHEIHIERFSIDGENAELINNAKEKGGRIIAVGTTSVRTLEAIGEGGKLRASNGTTQLFIQPGYKFKIVDAMITNFHLPKSTLLALVGAFAGMENVMAAYRHAIDQRYRFFSYGDAMLIV